MQVFVGSQTGISQDAFERKLYLIRKSATKAIRDSGMHSTDLFYVCSLSSRTLVYKGMLSTEQLPKFFMDLQDPDYESHLAMVHSQIFHEHATQLVTCSTAAVDGTQWRNQYAARKSQLDHGTPGVDVQRGFWR